MTILRSLRDWWRGYTDADVVSAEIYLSPGELSAIVAESNKAAADLLAYGVGVMFVPGDGGAPKHISWRDMMK